MKKTPTLLMKELKFINVQIQQLFEENIKKSCVPVNDDLNCKYSYDFDLQRNVQEINRLYEEERKIKLILAKFNATTLAKGTNLTIAEALVRIAELRSEIKNINVLAEKDEYFEDRSKYYDSKVSIYKILYDSKYANEVLHSLLQELSELQIAIDTTNLTTFIDC